MIEPAPHTQGLAIDVTLHSQKSMLSEDEQYHDVMLSEDEQYHDVMPFLSCYIIEQH
jgi:hypothetical protein